MSMKKQSGFNLIEVMVTIAITTVGLLGISSLQLQSNRATQDSGNRTQAVWMLEDLANRINANSAALVDYETNGNYVCPANPPTMCADHHDGTQRIAVAACTIQEVAAFDIWDVACSRGYTSNNTAIRLSAADFISNPRLNISIDQVLSRAVMSLTWDVRTSGTDNSGNTLYIVDDSVENRTATLIREVQL